MNRIRFPHWKSTWSFRNQFDEASNLYQRAIQCSRGEEKLTQYAALFYAIRAQGRAVKRLNLTSPGSLIQAGNGPFPAWMGASGWFSSSFLFSFDQKKSLVSLRFFQASMVFFFLNKKKKRFSEQVKSRITKYRRLTKQNELFRWVWFFSIKKKNEWKS